MDVNGETQSNKTEAPSGESLVAVLVIEAFILCIIILTAVVGNVSIWIIILKTRALRTITNMFILGLSAADLLVSTANMPLTVISLITHQWPLSEVACVVFGFINMLTLVTSVLSLCNISINRYFMVCRPTKFQGVYTKRNAIFMIMGVVSLSLILSSPPLFGWGEYAYIPVQSFCFCDWANHLTYAIFMITCCFGGPCSVMIVCNIFIYRAVRASRRKLVKGLPTESSSVITAIVNEKSKSQPYTIAASMSENEFDSIHHCSSKNELLSINQNTQINNERNKEITQNREIGVTNGIDGPILFELNNDLDPKTFNNNSADLCCADQSMSLDIEAGTTTDETENRRNDTLSATISSRLSSVTITSSKCVSTGRSLKRPSTKLKRREEHRLAMSLTVVVIVFVICWMPFCISMLIMIFAETTVPREFHMFTLLLGYANSCCNPIIYGLMNKRFAVGFKDLYCFWKKRFRMPVLSSP